MSPSYRIRMASPEDVPEIFSMICELAEFEKAAHEVQSNEALLHASLFADEPAVWCSILEERDDTGSGVGGNVIWHVAGFAIWFRNFFTWTA